MGGRSQSRKSGFRLRNDALAALRTTAREDLAALLRRHTRTETVGTLAVDRARLVSALHGEIVRICKLVPFHGASRTIYLRADGLSTTDTGQRDWRGG